MAVPRSRTLTPFVLSLLAGLAVLAFVVSAGATWVLARPATWTATSSFAVFPRADVDRQNEASLYETLSRGQIVTTLAQVVQSQQRAPGQELTVEVVPETSLVTLTASASTREAAERLAALGLRGSLADIDGLGLPFDARVVDGGPGSGEQATGGAPRLLAIVVLVGLVLGVVTQQAVAVLARRAPEPER